MRRLAVFALLALAGCGGGAPSEVVPADATTYIGVDAGEAERIVVGISRADVDFERDVQPWLGDRAAYFAMTDDESGLVFEIEGEDAAEAFARKVTVTLEDGRLEIESGDPTGDGLDETRAYRDAERRLEGPPALLLVDDPGYLADRDSVEDGRRVVRIVQTS